MRNLEGEIANYLIELQNAPERIQTKRVRARLLAMLKFPLEEAPSPMVKDRDLNDPLDLWGVAPGYRCWAGRHAQCEPLGADESCTCACGIGGHGRDMDGVRTDGCTCGQEGLGEEWHAQDCVWRSTWRERIYEAAMEAAGGEEP